MLLFNMASSFPLRETTRRVHVIPTSFPLSAGLLYLLSKTIKKETRKSTYGKEVTKVTLRGN